jgi:hypothetical protein
MQQASGAVWVRGVLLGPTYRSVMQSREHFFAKLCHRFHETASLLPRRKCAVSRESLRKSLSPQEDADWEFLRYVQDLRSMRSGKSWGHL